ncbi:MAG: M56 family metallopeptidase [Lachnospiraceae bacterium]|nr:M56 family metallopeptidase [Lachnospiraceae bacterium]
MINFTMNMPFYLMVFYGSMMIAIVLVLRGLLKNKLPKFVFPVLWGVILLRLLIPFSVSSPLSMKVPFTINFPLMEQATSALAVDEYVLYDGSISQTQNSPHTVEMADTDALIAGGAVSQDTTYYEGTGYFGHFTEYSGMLWRILPFLYFPGLIITAGILLFQKYSYTTRLKDSLLVEHNETINALLREMNMGHILVFTNDQIASPLVSGLIAPKIYLPTRMDFNNKELLRHILCHEVMHIRRGDNLFKFIMLVTLCIHWFNPLVWIMSRYMAADMETACDEAVLRLYHDEDAKKSYAFSLLAMAITGSRPTLLYSAFSKTAVERRVSSILRYKKAPVFVIALSICFVLCGSVVFATGGQAPFDPYFTSFCSSDTCRFGVRVSLTRGVSLGENAERRAEQVIFDVMHEDTSNDPDVLSDRIKKALSEEFHVEAGAFATDLSLILDREELFEEYAKWGLVRPDLQNDTLRYNGETIRRFSDEMLGRYQSQQEGTVDITIIRDRLGYITAVTAFHAGDAEYDRRTRNWYD